MMAFAKVLASVVLVLQTVVAKHIAEYDAIEVHQLLHEWNMHKKFGNEVCTRTNTHTTLTQCFIQHSCVHSFVRVGGTAVTLLSWQSKMLITFQMQPLWITRQWCALIPHNEPTTSHAFLKKSACLHRTNSCRCCYRRFRKPQPFTNVGNSKNPQKNPRKKPRKNPNLRSLRVTLRSLQGSA